MVFMDGICYTSNSSNPSQLPTCLSSWLKQCEWVFLLPLNNSPQFDESAIQWKPASSVSFDSISFFLTIEFLLSFLTTLDVARRSRSSHSYGERQSDLFRASLHLQECVFLHYGHFISGLFLRVQQITSSRSFPASHSERLIEGLCEL